MNINDIIGSSGVFIVLVAYFLSILKVFSPTSTIYFFLNFLGAGIACYASYLINYIPFIILEATWSLVSLAAFIKSLKNEKNFNPFTK